MNFNNTRSNPEWTEIVPALPHEEAKERLRLWKESRVATGEVVEEEHIREDVIHAVGNRTLFRYCVRRPS